MKLLVKIVYKPFGIIFGLASGIIARKLFEALWSKIDEREPPEPDTANATWPMVLGAAAMKSSSLAVTKAAGERASAKAFHYLFGVWPGEQEAKKTEA